MQSLMRVMYPMTVNKEEYIERLDYIERLGWKGKLSIDNYEFSVIYYYTLPV